MKANNSKGYHQLVSQAPNEKTSSPDLTYLERDQAYRQSLPWSRFYFVALHILTIALAASLLFLGVRGSVCLPGTTSTQSWSPIQDSIKYTTSGENAFGHSESVYQGPPTPERDEAWAQLTHPAFFLATCEELKKSGDTCDDAVKPSDSKDGYMASLAVYHELHCLRHLRYYLYRDHYYPNLTMPQQEYLLGHLGHCIESLRLTIMCYGNPALLTFTWDGAKSDYKPAARSSARSRCVDWKSVEDWSARRSGTNNIPVHRPGVQR
ncbi:protein of unknown function (DUF3328) domain containing protein [Naviculisporaceae sp. PSN 640]